MIELSTFAWMSLGGFMNNKLLINIIVPTIQLEFNVYIPNNKKIGTIKRHILNSIVELSNGYYSYDIERVILMDRDTGTEYSDNVIVNESNIQNGTKIIII